MLNAILRLFGRRTSRRAMVQHGLQTVPMPLRLAGPLPIVAFFMWRNRARIREMYHQYIAPRLHIGSHA